MQRRKKRPDPFTEIAEAVIAFAVEPSVTEEFIDGINKMSRSEFELWLVGAGSACGAKADDAQVVTITDKCELGMKPSKNR